LRARDDRAGVRAAYLAAQRVLAQQHAKLITPQHPQVPIDDCSSREAVGIGVVGDHQVSADLRCARQGEVDSPGFLGIRKRHGRKSRIGLGLLGDHISGRKAASLDNPIHQ
jgi:hypothetical protein